MDSYELVKNIIEQRITLYLGDFILPYIGENKYKLLLKIKQDKEYKLKLHILQHVEFVVKLFQANNIQFFIIKGIALDKIIYNGISMRESRDIDIVVRRESMSDAIDLLLNNDYIFTTDRNGNSKSVSVGFSDIVQHEITFLNQDKTIEVELKQLLNGIFDKSFIEDCFKNIKVIEIKDVLIPTLNVDYTLLVLIAYVYKDSEDIFVLNQTKLRNFIDLKEIIMKYRSELNWKEIFSNCKKYKIMHMARSVLLNLAFIFKDNTLLQTISNLSLDYNVDYQFQGILDKGVIDWNISIIERLFRDDLKNNEIDKKILEPFFGKTALNNYTIMLGSKYNLFDQFNRYTQYIVSSDLNNYIKFDISLDTKFFNNNQWFVLDLYYKDVKMDFRKIHIIIELLNDKECKGYVYKGDLFQDFFRKDNIEIKKLFIKNIKDKNNIKIMFEINYDEFDICPMSTNNILSFDMVICEFVNDYLRVTSRSALSMVPQVLPIKLN